MAQEPGWCPAVRPAAGGPLTCPTRTPTVPCLLLALGCRLCVPMASGSGLQGHRGPQSHPVGTVGFGSGSCGAPGPSHGGARRGGPQRWGARAQGWLLGDGLQGGAHHLHRVGVGICRGGRGGIRAGPTAVPTGHPSRQAPHGTRRPCTLPSAALCLGPLHWPAEVNTRGRSVTWRSAALSS